MLVDGGNGSLDGLVCYVGLIVDLALHDSACRNEAGSVDLAKESDDCIVTRLDLSALS